jgi:signal transduction histidine kinase
MFSELWKTMCNELHALSGNCFSNIRFSGELLLNFMTSSWKRTRKAPLFLQPVDLVSLVMTAYRCARPSAAQHGIQLVLRCDAQIPAVTLDQPKMLRVISELLDNAIRFSSAGQTVELRLSVRGPNVEIAGARCGTGDFAGGYARTLYAVSQARARPHRRRAHAQSRLVLRNGLWWRIKAASA